MSFSHLSGSSISNTNSSNQTGKRTLESSTGNTSRAGLVQLLEEELKIECKQTDRQRRLYSTLLREYEIIRQQLAEARLHIDRLRFGAHVDVYKHYIITHSLVPRDSSLPQRIADILQRRDPSLAPLSELNPGDSSSEAEDRMNPSVHFPRYLVTEMESQVSPEVAGLVQNIYSLQQHVATLEGGIKRENVPFEELRQRLTYVQEQHRVLSKGVANVLSNTDEEVGEEIRSVLQEELLKLAQQLQNLNHTLKSKAQQLLSTAPLPNNGSTDDRERRDKVTHTSSTLSELPSRYLENGSHLSTSMESLSHIPVSAQCPSQPLLHAKPTVHGDQHSAEHSDSPVYSSISFSSEQHAKKGKRRKKKEVHQKEQGHWNKSDSSMSVSSESSSSLIAYLPPGRIKEAEVLPDDDHQIPQRPSKPQACRSSRDSLQTIHKGTQRHTSPHTLTDPERANLLGEGSSDKVQEYLEHHQTSLEWHIPLEMDSGYMGSSFYGSTNSSPRPPLNVPNLSVLDEERRMDRGRSNEMEDEDHEWEEVPRNQRKQFEAREHGIELAGRLERMTAGERLRKEERTEELKHLQKKRERGLEEQKQSEKREKGAEVLGQLEQERIRKMYYEQRQSKQERETEEQRKLEKERERVMEDPKHQMREREGDTSRANERTRGQRAKHENGGLSRETMVEDDSKSTCSASSTASKTTTQESSTREALESLKQEFQVLSEQLQDMQKKQSLAPLPTHQGSHQPCPTLHPHQKEPFQSTLQGGSFQPLEQLHPPLQRPHSLQPYDQPNSFPPVDQPPLDQAHPSHSDGNPFPFPPVDQPHTHHPADQPHPLPRVDQPHPSHPDGNPFPFPPVDQPHPLPPVDQPHPSHPVGNPFPFPPVDQPHTQHPVDQPHLLPPVDQSYPLQSPHKEYKFHQSQPPPQPQPFQPIHQPQCTREPDTHLPAHEQQAFALTGLAQPASQQQTFLLPTHDQLQPTRQDQQPQQQLPVRHPSHEQPFQQDVDWEQAAHCQQPTPHEEQQQPAVWQAHPWQPPNHTLPEDGQPGHPTRPPLQGQAFLPIHQPSSTILQLPKPSDQTLRVNGQGLDDHDTSIPVNPHSSSSVLHAPTLQESCSLPPTSAPHHGGSFPPTSLPHHGSNLPPTSLPHHGSNLPPTSLPHNGSNLPPTSLPHYGSNLPPTSLLHHGSNLPPTSLPHNGSNLPPTSLPHHGSNLPPTSLPHHGSNLPPTSLLHHGSNLPPTSLPHHGSNLPPTSIPHYSNSLPPTSHFHNGSCLSAAPLTRSLPVTINHASSSTPYQEGKQTQTSQHQQQSQCRVSDQPQGSSVFTTKGPALSDSAAGLVYPHQQEAKQPHLSHQQQHPQLHPLSYWTSSEPPSLRTERTRAGMAVSSSPNPAQPNPRFLSQSYNPPAENLENQAASSSRTVPTQRNDYRTEHRLRNPSTSSPTVPDNQPHAPRSWCTTKTFCRHCRGHVSPPLPNRGTTHCHPQPDSQQNGSESLVSLPTSVSSHQPRLARKLEQHFSAETIDGSGRAQDAKQRLVCPSSPSAQMAVRHAQHTQLPHHSHQLDTSLQARGEGRHGVSLLRCHDSSSGSSDGSTESCQTAARQSKKQTYGTDTTSHRLRCHFARTHHGYHSSPQITLSETRQQRRLRRMRRSHTSDPTIFLSPGTQTPLAANSSLMPRLGEFPAGSGSDCDEVFVTSLDKAECLAHKLQQASLRLNKTLHVRISMAT